MKPSDLIKIRDDVTDIVIFEPWDYLTKRALQDYMGAFKIKYRAAELLDIDNNLKIWIVDDAVEHLLII